MGCATSLVKYLLFFFNFIFVVGGIGLVALGALTYTRFAEYDDLTAELGVGGFRGPPIVMMVGGAIVFFIAFLGCCGAIRESHVMMSTYGAILTILLIVEVGAIIAASIYKDDAEHAIQQGLIDSMKNYGGDTEIDKEQTLTWDNLQQRLHCCGVNGTLDWQKEGKQTSLPESCCIDKEDCPRVLPVLAEDKVYNEGCYSKVIKEIGIPLLIAIGAAIGAVELLGVIFGCCLAARYKNKDYRPR